MIKSVLRKPTSSDDKYSRGVVGFITGSNDFAGAAVLGVTAALRSGVGMVRYIGPDSVNRLILETRPEVVLGAGRVQAWVVGSGVSANADAQLAGIQALLAADSDEFLVIDAGALELISPNMKSAGRAILTPHEGEARRLLARLNPSVSSELTRLDLAREIQKQTGCTVLLKGSRSIIVDCNSQVTCPEAPSELATAGTGDVLAGIIGGLVAVNADEIQNGRISLLQVATVAIEVHSRAAANLAALGPITALDLANEVGRAISELRS